jgi:protein phosphatase
MNEERTAPRLDVFGLTDTGKKRSHNEDQFLVARLEKSMTTLFSSLESETSLSDGSEEGYLFVVADGVGGAAAGELASGATVETLAEQIGTAIGCFYGTDPDAEHEFMELMWPRGYIFHVGDSRGYYLRRGVLKQFTRDQTVGEFMVDAGLLTEEAARKGGLDNVLTHAIGGDESTPSIGLVDFQAGDVLMLCSDGLTKHVSDGAIRHTLGTTDTAESSCQALLDMALEGGGSDNITVVVARVED